MDRREAIRKTALLMGSVVSAPTIMGILQGCSTKPTLDWKPTFFNEDQAYVVSQIAEIFIPKTDTPGAKDVGVPAFIEQMVSTVYNDETKGRFMSGLETFMKGVEANTGDSFSQLELEKQIEQVQLAQQKAKEEEQEFWNNIASQQVRQFPKPFILLSKELTLLGFFTSEPGATQVLQYEAVPGAYHGCIPLSEAGGKTWATS